MERSLFTLDWLRSGDLRRRTNAGLNKGEARNALTRAVFFHRLGELRDRTFENQSVRAEPADDGHRALENMGYSRAGSSPAGRVHSGAWLQQGRREKVMERRQQFVGLDVSQREASVCVVDGMGCTTWQGRCASDPEAISAVLRARAPDLVRVGLESGPLSTWHWHALTELGLPVVCLDARHAKAMLSMQLNKSDVNDAHGLAQIVRVGWYREVRVKGMNAHLMRTLLGARTQLVAVQRTLGSGLTTATRM